MCGITGIIAKTGTLSEDTTSVVQDMCEALYHRGPDEAGYFNDANCALAMRRLSIIDLESGTQPIENENGDILVFSNGEIYNYQALREDLKKQGHQFKTQSDTEVLLHLYEEYGESMFAYLNGMYAFCLYDKPKNTFIIGRDSMGEKPLYYYENSGSLSFSSELKSLMGNKRIPRELSIEALGYYLRTSLIPEPLCLFEGVKSLAPGHYSKIENGSVSVHQYFAIKYNPNTAIKSNEEAINLIKPKLVEAVRRQAISDVPIGAFLSGGIDSSTTVALLQKQSSSPIKTFNVKFNDQAYDESKIAKEVAKFCGTEHYEIEVPNAEFTEDIFWEIIDHVGQPFRDSSAIPTHLVTKEIAKHVKVAISGDGGDELFGGYDVFKWYTKTLKLKKVPQSVRHISQGGIKLAQNLASKSSSLRKLNRAFSTAQNSDSEVAISLNEMFASTEISSILQDKNLIDINGANFLEVLHQYPKEANNWSDLRRIMYYRTKHTLPGNMLVKIDRMSMANSLEVRAPFLDRELFEAAAQLPEEFLINGGIGKYVIREMMKDDLPESVFSHPKQGFNMPLHKYQNKTYRRLAQRLLFDENPMPDLFKQKELEGIVKRGLDMKQDSNELSVYRASHQLWMIMQFLGWAERFGVNYTRN